MKAVWFVAVAFAAFTVAASLYMMSEDRRFAAEVAPEVLPLAQAVMDPIAARVGLRTKISLPDRSESPSVTSGCVVLTADSRQWEYETDVRKWGFLRKGKPAPDAAPADGSPDQQKGPCGVEAVAPRGVVITTDGLQWRYVPKGLTWHNVPGSMISDAR